MNSCGGNCVPTLVVVLCILFISYLHLFMRNAHSHRIDGCRNPIRIRGLRNLEHLNRQEFIIPEFSISPNALCGLSYFLVF